MVFNGGIGGVFFIGKGIVINKGFKGWIWLMMGNGDLIKLVFVVVYFFGYGFDEMGFWFYCY